MTASNPSSQKATRHPSRTILPYTAAFWLLDAAQLTLSIIQLGRGPVSDADPPGVYLTLPGYFVHLHRLAVVWASLGLVVNILAPVVVGVVAGRRDKEGNPVVESVSGAAWPDGFDV
ncbi:hypothetical protein C8A01DRAFT_32040 [Parachaetomium inaequale]|uniref:Uncharacterized protein n=1 Tax=Parachaetomium inaequale TaxID=2588326 RepID=A0AAN6SVB7_9PEZI|nr:hypothetical protein C8A01DRAFT_32040 [Parachaetomium inaequale]